jgi:membrane-associated phospholipid phosphatase
MDAVDFSSFQPGNFQQDVVTLPLEAALLYSATEWLPTTKPPLWPFENESNTEVRHNSRHPAPLAAAMGAGILVPSLAATAWFRSYSAWATHASGIAHTVLLTELATISSKKLVGRHRPNYDRAEAAGGASDDDHYSFWSGHSAHAFALAGYSSRLLFDAAPAPAAWCGSVLFLSTASWIATGRVLDNAHHASDVVVGGVVGLAISQFLYGRVESGLSRPSTTSWRAEPTLPGMRLTVQHDF